MRRETTGRKSGAAAARMLVASAIASIATVTTAAAADPAAAFRDDPDYVTTHLGENDRFGGQGQDRWYTSGLLSSVLLPSDATPFLASDRARRWLGDDPTRLELSIGQDIFTPAEAGALAPNPDDRPFGAYLFVGADLVTLRADRAFAGFRGLVEDRIGVRVGALGGTWSLGEFVFETAHGTLFEGSDANTADFGLESEPAGGLVARRDFHMFADAPFGLGVSARPSVAASLGTVETHLGVGLELRLGDDLEYDLTRRDNRAGVGGGGFYGPPDGFAWSLYAGAQGRAVAHNAFLDGNVFRDGPDDAIDIDGRALVGELYVGLNLTTDWGRIGASYVYRTEEFVEQPEAQSFGMIAFGFRF